MSSVSHMVFIPSNEQQPLVGGGSQRPLVAVVALSIAAVVCFAWGAQEAGSSQLASATVVTRTAGIRASPYAAMASPRRSASATKLHSFSGLNKEIGTGIPAQQPVGGSKLRESSQFLLRSAAAVSGVVALLGGALLMRYPRKVAMCATTESPAGTDAAPAEEDRRWSLLQQYKDHDVVFSVDILSENPAGFEVDFLGMGGFMPKSQTAPSTLSGSPVGKTVEVKLLELDIPTRFLVSQKAAGPPAKTLADIEEKALYEGTVTNVREFGVFVDLGGVEGLLHVSQISNERVDSVSAIFTRGDAVKCVVDSVDADRNRISLGTWQLEPERGDMKKDKQAVFEKAEATYAAFKERPAAASRQETSMEGLTEGELYEGKVVNVKDFGAFVDLGDGKPQGLLHISQISCLRVDSVYNVFQVGDTVKCMLLSKDTERNRIGLSTWQLEVEEGDMINDKEAVFAKAEETLAAYWEKEEEGGTWSDNE